MHDLIFRLHKGRLITRGGLFLALTCITAFGGLHCFGQFSSLTPQVMTAQQQQQVKWTAGPTTASLGEVADIEIPEGYRLVDAAGARVLLQRRRNPVPAGLVGILMPDSGQWWAILEFNQTGYLTSTSARRINAPAVLKKMWATVEAQNGARAKQGAPQVKSIQWDLAPEYDTTNHSLACSIRIETPTEAIVNQSIRLFSRSGVLQAMAVQNAKDSSPTLAIKDLLARITFKAGQRYEDFQEGDKMASVDSYQLLTGDDQAAVAADQGWKAVFTPQRNKWIVGSLGAVMFVVVFYLIYREIRSLNPRQSFRSSAAQGAEPKARKVRRTANNADASGRKRAFDYQKYYSDMMMQVSTRAYGGFTLKPEEELVEESGDPSAADSASSGAIADAQKGAASELIARQKDFIEEQRRLMQQQTKLIEERSKLIEEKNQLLAKQSEMMENHLL